MTIKYNEKEIELKPTLRAFMIYENITGKNYQPETISDIVTMIYCLVIGSSKDYTIKFEDFITWLDDNPDQLGNISKWLSGVEQVNNDIKKN